MAHPRTLALDVGDRRIGLAITDPLGLTAQPLFTLHRTSLRADIKAIARFIRRHEVAILVVGHPLHADGSFSPQAARVREFVESLQADLLPAHPDLRVQLFDERLTTRDAHALLDHSGHAIRQGRQGRLERREIIDQVAATLLLQSFLSAGSPSLLPDPEAES